MNRLSSPGLPSCWPHWEPSAPTAAVMRGREHAERCHSVSRQPVLSQDHPSVREVGKTQEFGCNMLQLGVIWQIARIRTGSTTTLGNWSFLPDRLTTWDRYVLSAFPKFWVSFSELWNQTRPRCTHPETKLSLTNTHKHICVCIHMLTYGPPHAHVCARTQTHTHTTFTAWWLA